MNPRHRWTLYRLPVVIRCLKKGWPSAAIAQALEVSQKTVYRDIELLRDGFGMPAEWDSQQRCWRLDRSWELRIT